MSDVPHVLGLDVSSYQGHNLPLKAVYDLGARFVYVRSSVGFEKDVCFEETVRRAADAGLRIGAYHYFHADKRYFTQVKMLEEACEKIEMISGSHLNAWLDVERLPSSMTALALLESCEDFYNAFHMGELMLYSYPTFLAQLRAQAGTSYDALLVDNFHELAIAHYGVQKPMLPPGYTNCVMWQYDGNGGERLPDGRDCDWVYFNGNEAAFERWVKGEPEPPVAPPAMSPPANLAAWAKTINLTTRTREEDDRAADERGRGRD